MIVEELKIVQIQELFLQNYIMLFLEIKWMRSTSLFINFIRSAAI